VPFAALAFAVLLGAFFSVALVRLRDRR